MRKTATPPTLSILQLNTWLIRVFGIPISADFQGRLEALPRCLATENPDVIALMEVWGNRDKKWLADALKHHGYSYSIFSQRRDGLFVASRYPILRTEFSLPFRACTQPIEFFTCKRAVHVEILHPDAGEISLFATHLGAQKYNTHSRTFCQRARGALRSQLREFGEFFQSRSRGKRFVFIAGDLNFHYQAYSERLTQLDQLSDEYSSLTRLPAEEGLSLRNSFHSANRLEEHHPSHPTYSQLNPYCVVAGCKDHPNETLDYILYVAREDVRAVESRIVFDRIENEKVTQLSDHYGIHSKFILAPADTDVTSVSAMVPLTRKVHATRWRREASV